MYRDDRDAMLARAQALDLQLEEARRELAESDAEKSDAKAKVVAAEREILRLRKKLAKLDPSTRPSAAAGERAPRIVIFGVLLVVAILVGVLVIAWGPRRSAPPTDPGSPPHGAPQLVHAPEPRLSAEVTRAYLHRAALDELEAPVRVLWRTYLDNRATKDRFRHMFVMSWFEPGRALATVAKLADDPSRLTAYPEVETLATAYVSSARAVLPRLMEALRYYEHKDYLEDAGAKGEELAAELDALVPPFLELSARYRTAIDPAYQDYLKVLPTVRPLLTPSIVEAWRACGALAAAELADAFDRDRFAADLATCEAKTKPLLDSEAVHKVRGSYVVGLFDNLIRESKDFLRVEAKDRTRELSSLAQSFVYATGQFSPR